MLKPLECSSFTVILPGDLVFTQLIRKRQHFDDDSRESLASRLFKFSMICPWHTWPIHERRLESIKKMTMLQDDFVKKLAPMIWNSGLIFYPRRKETRSHQEKHSDIVSWCVDWKGDPDSVCKGLYNLTWWPSLWHHMTQGAKKSLRQTFRPFFSQGKCDRTTDEGHPVITIDIISSKIN